MNKMLPRIIKLLAILGAGYVIGLFSYIERVWPASKVRNVLERNQLNKLSSTAALNSEVDSYWRLVSYPGKKKISCPPMSDRTMVLLIIGQSNTANGMGQRYESNFGDKIINYFNSECYVASSPLLGTNGTAGEPWTLLGNYLLQHGKADRVVLISSGIGGTSVQRWASGDMNGLLDSVLIDVRERWKISAVLWHQGEQDFHERTSKDKYIREFQTLTRYLREKGVDAPIYISIASKCGLDPEWSPENQVAEAQRSLVAPSKGIYLGVDTDQLMGKTDRLDDCHFGQSGQEKFATAWLEIISNSSKHMSNR
jgi:hypothetical protein